MQPKVGKPVTWARPVFSPSQIAMADKCFRQWLLRYIHGIKTPDMASRGKALGILIHDCLAHYLRGGKLTDASLDTLSDNDRKSVEAYRANYAAENGQEKADAEIQRLLLDAPQRALTGLPFLPDASTSSRRLVETVFQLDTRTIHKFGAAIQFSDWSRLDLVVQRVDGVWFVYDHKSTSGDKHGPWSYVPTSEQLIDDVQLLLYAMAVMMANGLTGVWCRWIYYYTGPKFPAQAKPVDVFVTFDDCAARLQKYFDLCDMMSTEIKRTHALNALPSADAHPFPSNVLETGRPCDAYRGCGYRGQHCNPPPIPLENLVKQPTPKQESKTMGLGDRVQGMQANGYPAPVVNAPTLPVGDAVAGLSLPGQVAAAPAVVVATAPAPEPAAEAIAEPAPEKAKRGRKPAAPDSDPAAGLDGVDAALVALRDRATKLKAVIEVKITFDGQA